MYSRLKPISSSTLHLSAMLFMLLDHIRYTLFPNMIWMTCIGRIAFPLFAFMITEGYFHTKDLKKYFLRLVSMAIISEIPFNLMLSSSLLYPDHQNVIWTFLISLLGITAIERSVALYGSKKSVPIMILVIILGYIMGELLRCDYSGTGVLTVLVFYFFRRKDILNRIFLCISLFVINFIILAHSHITIPLSGFSLTIPLQGFAILAIVPILLYNGEKGIDSKYFRNFTYLFYPLHMLVLALLVII